jgi:hypothetical protein
VPQSRELLALAAERGEPLVRVAGTLLDLLGRYGMTELQAAVAEALQRGVPHPNAVRHALERRREARDLPPPVEITLPLHVQSRDTQAQPHNLDTYDQITEATHFD